MTFMLLFFCITDDRGRMDASFVHDPEPVVVRGGRWHLSFTTVVIEYYHLVHDFSMKIYVQRFKIVNFLIS